MEDLYAILGVSKKASADEIKKQYRKLAQKYHPDLNPGDRAAEERFKSISAAYSILGDEAKRKDYDFQLENPFKQGIMRTKLLLHKIRFGNGSTKRHFHKKIVAIHSILGQRIMQRTIKTNRYH